MGVTRCEQNRTSDAKKCRDTDHSSLKTNFSFHVSVLSISTQINTLSNIFRYPFHPRVTAVARKRSRSFCQKCRWQVTAKHAYTVKYVALHEVTWSMVVWGTQDLCQDSCSFMWHQPCQCCKYTTSVDIQKTYYKASHSCRTTCERSGSAQESGE